mmetsp:Transcript_59617/g.191847  ORF Transcript_59617/g.191847 Transcript_59617/m.191847 type:complete len:200 (+) Transcript_59617:289-888(+)
MSMLFDCRVYLTSPKMNSSTSTLSLRPHAICLKSERASCRLKPRSFISSGCPDRPRETSRHVSSLRPSATSARSCRSCSAPPWSTHMRSCSMSWLLIFAVANICSMNNAAMRFMTKNCAPPAKSTKKTPAAMEPGLSSSSWATSGPHSSPRRKTSMIVSTQRPMLPKCFSSTAVSFASSSPPSTPEAGPTSARKKRASV